MHLLRLINLEVPESILAVPIKKYAARVSEQMTGQICRYRCLFQEVPLPRRHKFLFKAILVVVTKLRANGVVKNDVNCAA